MPTWTLTGVGGPSTSLPSLAVAPPATLAGCLPALPRSLLSGLNQMVRSLAVSGPPSPAPPPGTAAAQPVRRFGPVLAPSWLLWCPPPHPQLRRVVQPTLQPLLTNARVCLPSCSASWFKPFLQEAPLAPSLCLTAPALALLSHGHSSQCPRGRVLPGLVLPQPRTGPVCRGKAVATTRQLPPWSPAHPPGGLVPFAGLALCSGEPLLVCPVCWPWPLPGPLTVTQGPSGSACTALVGRACPLPLSAS